MQKIGIVTVLYNSDKLLEDFFSSIAVQDYKNYILYLIDNTPGESTRQAIDGLRKKYFLTGINHLECPGNLGAAEGNNIGIQKAIADDCSAIILSNNDVYFTSNNLFSSLITLSESGNFAIIAPKIYYANSNKLWYAGGNILPWQASVIHYGNTKEDSIEFSKSQFTGYAPTTFVFIKAEVFNKVLMLDSKYFIYAEDLDFMYRAKSKGYSIWYEASLSLYHKVSSTTGGVFSDTGFYYNTRNRVYFSRKFYSPIKKGIAISYVFISLFYHALREKRTTAVKHFLTGFAEGFKMNISKNKSLLI